MKRKLLQTITLEQLRQHLGNSRVIRRFAEKNDLVYFGSVSTSDEARLVKGFTASRTQRDEHYCVGTTHGRDVMFVQRSDMLTDGLSKLKRKESYTWNILVVDLRETVRLPHAVLQGADRYGLAFRQALEIKHRELVDVPKHLMHGYDPLFIQKFQCRTSVVDAVSLPVMLSPLSAATLAHHFSIFDIEWQNDVLYIYHLSKQSSMEKLDLMLKCGIWLTGELEKSLECEL